MTTYFTSDLHLDSQTIIICFVKDGEEDLKIPFGNLFNELGDIKPSPIFDETYKNFVKGIIIKYENGEYPEKPESIREDGGQA